MTAPVGAAAGEERRRAARALGAGNMSFKVAVLAREGRGGGDVVFAIPFLLTTCPKESIEAALAAKGSCSVIRAVGVTDVRLCLRFRGLGFWRELRTRGGLEGGGDSVGVFDRTEDG